MSEREREERRHFGQPIITGVSVGSEELNQPPEVDWECIEHRMADGEQRASIVPAGRVDGETWIDAPLEEFVALEMME
jgi:hypothetical protein